MASLFHIKSSRLARISLLALAMFLLGGCAALFPHKTPYDFPDSTWESKEPYIYFYVSDLNPENSELYAIVNGERVKMWFLCDENTSYAEFWDPNSREYTDKGSGLTKCYLTVKHKTDSEEIKITIVEDNLFDGQYEEIVLERIE